MSFSQPSSTQGALLSLEAIMELYSSGATAALTSVVPLLDSSSGNIAVVHPRCDRVLVVRKSALALEIRPEFQRFFKPDHPEYFFLSLKYHTTHGPVTPASHPREISGIFIQCIGQLICVPPCQECRNAPQASTNSGLFFNLCVTVSNKDNSVANLCGSCVVRPDLNQTCTPTQIPSGIACAAYHLPYDFLTTRAFIYLPGRVASGKIKSRVLQDWQG